MSGGALSADRLARLHAVLAAHVESGDVPGLVACVHRRGETHVEVLGAAAVDGPPMRRDTIFRITSMTKPITAAAALILVEECRLRLDEPVDRWLPELAGRRVLRHLDAPLHDTVAAHRPITLRDLLTFRMGWGLVLGTARDVPILHAVADLGIGGFGAPDPTTPHDPDEWLARVRTLPLMTQPGERWMYNTGSYVLGVLIARVTGEPLEAFLRDRILAPLGMTDTAFSVPAEKHDRLAAAYRADPATGAPVLHDPAHDGAWSRPPAFPDAAAGLVSTVDDCLAFGRMLLAGGRHGRERILSRPSVALMTTDQITPEQKSRSAFTPGFWESRGWGLGVSVVTRRDDVWAVPGRYGWDGGFGTSWANDPAEELVGVLLTQRLWDSPAPPPVCGDFWTGAYQAIDD